MDRSRLRHRLDFYALEAKVIAKNALQGSSAFAAEERPRLDQARTDILTALPARDRQAAIAKLDRILECADLIEQRRFDAWNARRKADQMRYNAEADLQEAEIERLIVEISGHLGFH